MAPRRIILTEDSMPAKTDPEIVPDPEITPGEENRLFNPKKYYALQPQITVIMKRDESDVIKDPDNSVLVIHEEGINGYKIPLRMGYANTVPLDFATQLISRKKADPADHATYKRAMLEYRGVEIA